MFCHTIAELDLAPIERRLAKKGWSRGRIKNAVHGYRSFLQLAADEPDREMTPDVDVDAVWHEHILDTQKYADDCNTMFGYYLHHIPDDVREFVPLAAAASAETCFKQASAARSATCFKQAGS